MRGEGGRGGRRTEAGPSGDDAKVNSLYHAQLEELTHAGAAKQPVARTAHAFLGFTRVEAFHG